MTLILATAINLGWGLAVYIAYRIGFSSGWIRGYDVAKGIRRKV